jgi:hypothetical protein
LHNIYGSSREFSNFEGAAAVVAMDDTSEQVAQKKPRCSIQIKTEPKVDDGTRAEWIENMKTLQALIHQHDAVGGGSTTSSSETSPLDAPTPSSANTSSSATSPLDAPTPSSATAPLDAPTPKAAVMQKQEAFDDGGPNAAANVSENQDAAADDERELSLFQQQKQAHPDHEGNVPPLPGGMAQKNLDRSTRAQLWATYQRSLTVPQAPGSRAAEKCPDHIREEVFNSMEAKQFYFQVWLNQPKPKWANVRVVERHYTEKRKGSLKTDAWMTDGQLMIVYNDREVVDELKSWCESQVKPIKARKHPQIPSVKKARQFCVTIEDQQREKIEQVLEQGIQMSADVDREHGEPMVRSFLEKSHDAFCGTAGASPMALPAPPVLPPVAASAASATVARSATSPEDTRKAEALAEFEKKEVARRDKALARETQKQADLIQRRQDQEAARVARVQFAATPEGRAREWLQGLQAIISNCMAQVAHCNSSECLLPANLAKEYGATWSQKVSSLKRARTSIEKILNKEKTVEDFESVISNAEDQVKSFKHDLQNYRVLERGYKRKADITKK